MELLSFLFHFIQDLFFGMFDSPNKDNSYSSELGKVSSIGSYFNNGFVFSGNRRLTRAQSFQNFFVCGETGSSKSASIILPNLFELKNCSIVVTDPDGSLFKNAGGYLSRHFDVQRLNFSDSSISSTYNFLNVIKKSNDITKIVDLLSKATVEKGSSSDPFWGLQNRQILTIFTKLVLFQPKKYHNLFNVNYLVKVFAVYPEKIDKLIAATNDKALVLNYQALNSLSEKTLQSVIATAKSSLFLWDDEEIAKVSSSHSIDFQEYRDPAKRKVLFLHTSVENSEYTSILIEIFFQQFFSFLLSENESELPLYFIIEEASTYCIPLLSKYLAQNRKKNVGNIICCQTPNQLKVMYKDDYKSIMENCVTKLYLKISNMDVLNEIERFSGKIKHTDENGTLRVKNLLTVDKLRTLPKHKSVILTSNSPITIGKLSPFYKSWKYKSYSKIPAPVMESVVSNEPIPLIPV